MVYCKSEILTMWWGSSSWTHLHVDLNRVNRHFVIVCNCEAPVALQVQEGVWGLGAFRSDTDAAVWAIPYFPVTADKRLFNQQEQFNNVVTLISEIQEKSEIYRKVLHWYQVMESDVILGPSRIMSSSSILESRIVKYVWFIKNPHLCRLTGKTLEVAHSADENPWTTLLVRFLRLHNIFKTI